MWTCTCTYAYTYSSTRARVLAHARTCAYTHAFTRLLLLLCMCARADMPAAAALEGLAKLHERRGQDAEALAAFEQAIAVRKSGNAGGGFLREIADGEAKLAALRERVHAHVGDFIKKTSPERVRAHSPTPPTFPLPANAVTRPHGPRAKALCTTMARMDAMMDDACLPPTAAAGAMAGACAAGGAAEAETIDDSTVADGVEAGADGAGQERARSGPGRTSSPPEPSETVSPLGRNDSDLPAAP